MAKKIILWFSLAAGLVLLINNAYHYPPNGGYDAAIHMYYAKIISHQWRLPTLLETREAYNPPLFYILSGLITRLASSITQTDFFIAAKAWQFFSIPLVIVTLYLWFRIIKKLYPQNKLLQTTFILLLFSLPVFHKTVVMFSLELFFMFLITLSLWYFFIFFLPKPDLKKTLVLALLTVFSLLTRMSAVVLLISLIVGFIGLGLIKRLSWKKLTQFLLIFLFLVTLGTSWFYYGRRHQDIYGVGEGGQPNIPFSQRQPASFFLDVPFKFMMTYPIRMEQPINKLIPIYYSDFWGDFWNYYPQRRFGITVPQVRQNRQYTTPQRVANLALQNQVNLLPTILIILGFIYLFIRLIKGFKKPTQKWLMEFVFFSFTCLTWFGFLALLTKYPSWKSDSVKPAYMLSNLPIFIYVLVIFLFDKIKPHKIIAIPVFIWLTLATSLNLWFSWF